MTLEKRVYDGNRAKEILDNEVFQQVWIDIEQEYVEAWKNSPARDEEGRQKIWVYVQLMQKLKAQIVSTFESGKMAKLELEHRSKLERMKDGVTSWLA